MEAANIFENAWAEHIVVKLNKEDKKSVSQVSKAARQLVFRTVGKLRANCYGSLGSDRFTKLKELELQGDVTNIGTFVQDVGISSLIIRHNSLKRDVVRAIASVTTLKTLDLQHTIVKDLGDISALRSLTELNLQSVPYISKIEDLSRLSVLTALVTLHIGHSDVERSLLHEFRYFFPYLIELDMCYSRLLTHSGARFRFSSFPHLVSLTLDGYADMRDLTPLENLGHFKSFAFRDCNLQNDWLTSFRFTTKLEHLAISRNASLSDEGICHLSVLRSLRTLECNQLENVTTNGITRLLPDLPRLVSLYLAGSGSNEVYEDSSQVRHMETFISRILD